MKDLVEKMLPCGHSITFGTCGAAGEPGQMTHQKDEQIADAYEDFFRVHDKFDPSDVLEVGVCRGGSLAIWREIFPHADRIVGLDHDLSKLQPWTLDHLQGCVQGVQVLNSRMPDERTMDFLGSFDLIIDDGEHGPENVFPVFEMCWPRLRPGGIYVVEDWHQDFLKPHELILHFVDKLLGDRSAPRGPAGGPLSITAHRAFFALRK